MYYSEILFKKEPYGFYHNLECDFACFALWKTARPYRDRIRELLTLKFEILLETEIIWTTENFKQNAARLYEAPIKSNVPKEKWPKGHEEKIGDTKFILFVVKDCNPHYTYAMSVSKKIELSNLNVVAAKYQIRDWIYDDLKTKFAVHSTNNIQEFFFQAPLILGVELFKKLMDGEKLKIPQIAKDLEGANGWNSYKEVFEILNLTCNYLVLRGFEGLPEENPEKDIDVLTDNYQRFASALGATQVAHQPYKGKVKVNSENISLDIRYIGDKYYDVAWTKEMLQTKVNRNSVFVPREDHYFFSLLFHAKVQKPKVKEKYISILERLAENLKFNWYDANKLHNDKAMGELLNGYFRANHYYYKDPLDKGVYKNEAVIKHIQSNRALTTKIWTKRIEGKLMEVLPVKTIKVLKKIKRKF
ncbi:hypothetical protein EI546_06285 [Aequorivita sp. H23M31]|uniref:Uncharacterized protein n=1 Tax=Aequorivita ciconiae TaxID=2494375 RepID=A0A410G246_9FLAO|nr:hypothetical protein [Aequorivita sp. H23M31]QAA81358.1 hypothetical protein EI546_06285 [Aequorivita sp. H23M31]